MRTSWNWSRNQICWDSRVLYHDTPPQTHTYTHTFPNVFAGLQESVLCWLWPWRASGTPPSYRWWSSVGDSDTSCLWLSECQASAAPSLSRLWVLQRFREFCWRYLEIWQCILHPNEINYKTVLILGQIFMHVFILIITTVFHTLLCSLNPDRRTDAALTDPLHVSDFRLRREKLQTGTNSFHSQSSVKT